jgi:hypothetical protein
LRSPLLIVILFARFFLPSPSVSSVYPCRLASKMEDLETYRTPCSHIGYNFRFNRFPYITAEKSGPGERWRISFPLMHSLYVFTPDKAGSMVPPFLPTEPTPCLEKTQPRYHGEGAWTSYPQLMKPSNPPPPNCASLPLNLRLDCSPKNDLVHPPLSTVFPYERVSSVCEDKKRFLKSEATTRSWASFGDPPASMLVF